MTVQPAIEDLFFEMEDAARWFGRHYTKLDSAQLMSLYAALDPMPGYLNVQEQKFTKVYGTETREWHHFQLYRPAGPFTLAVVLGMSSRVSIAQSSEELWGVWAMPPPVTWRVWLYEHRQGRGWVCLNPGDDSHEVVRELRARMILEALK